MRKLRVYAKTRARREGVEERDAHTFVVRVREVPEHGRANAAIIKILARYLHIPQSRLTLVSGFSSSIKVFVIS